MKSNVLNYSGQDKQKTFYQLLNLYRAEGWQAVIGMYWYGVLLFRNWTVYKLKYRKQILA